MTKCYTINIYKLSLIKVGNQKKKKRMFTKIDTYKHIPKAELSKKSIELHEMYHDWCYYSDIVDESTNNCMIEEGLQ